MTTEMTIASRGRWMKTEEIIGGSTAHQPAGVGAGCGATVIPARIRCWP
jgi:hypothetical protein